MNSLESTTLKAKGAVCYLKVSTAEQAQQNNSPVQESKHCTSNNLPALCTFIDKQSGRSVRKSPELLEYCQAIPQTNIFVSSLQTFEANTKATAVVNADPILLLPRMRFRAAMILAMARLCSSLGRKFPMTAKSKSREPRWRKPYPPSDLEERIRQGAYHFPLTSLMNKSSGYMKQTGVTSLQAIFGHRPVASKVPLPPAISGD